MDKSIDRIKCAMIIFELERGLGRICKEQRDLLNNSPTAKEISKRTPEKASDHQSIIENSYLAEVIAIALHVYKGTSLEPWLTNLNGLVVALSLFEIRNAVSHPNRPFPSFYWYRCAAIASDPAIDALGLNEVAHAFINANEGRIQEPPEEWLHKMRWSVPALLPDEFEHAITGLLGRTKDIARLERELENSRLPLIAIVARGGVGKTSLLLQVVSDFCLSPKSTKYFDGAVWETLKQERLTKDGIEQLAAPASLDEIKSGLCSSISDLFGIPETDWNGILETAGEKRLLLCLDNLEVLLRDNAKEFQQLHESLPTSWKVVVTSRIPVDGAKNLPLDVLDKSGSVAMVRAYLTSKGYLLGKDTEFMETIAIGCKFNPLAIRLTSDLFLAGREIDFAIQKTEQEVLAFSFTSLLETLSSLDNDILESLFVLDTPTRADLCNALKASVDSAAESLSKLLSMSLILRHERTIGEGYSLAPSIKDLLRANPRHLSVRSKITTWLSNSRATEEHARRVQAERNISPVAPNYIPPDAIAAYISLCQTVDAAIKNGNRPVLAQALATCRSKIALDCDSSFLHRILGNALLGLDDAPEAIINYQRAATLKPDDPAPLFGLLTAYNDMRRWRDIEIVGDKLISENWGEPDNSGAYFANRIWSATLRSANLTENVSKVFEKTLEWESRLEDLPALAVSRASAYRRVIEIENRQNKLETERLINLLAKCSTILSKVIESSNSAKWIAAEIGRLITDIKKFESINLMNTNPSDSEAIHNFLKACAKNGSKLRLENISTDLLKYCQNITGESSIQESFNDEKYTKRGFIITSIKSGFNASERYFFVQDSNNKDYYVNISVFEDGARKNRVKLRAGSRIAIRHEEAVNGRAPKAIEAWLVK